MDGFPDHDRRREALPGRMRALRLGDLPEQGHRTGWFPWLLCLLFVGLSGYLAMSRSGKTADAEAFPTTRPGPVMTTTPAASSGRVVLEAKGHIVPAHQIQVSPKISGLVTKLYIEEGRRVNRGDVLAQLETTDYRADVDLAQSALEAARQRLLEMTRGHRPEEIAQARAELAEVTVQRERLFREWQRTSRLHRDKALASSDLDLAESDLKAIDHKVERLRNALQLMIKGQRAERIDAARAEVQQAEAELVKARWRLDNCTIRAPISGTILSKTVEEGSIINPTAYNVSASLCEMADLTDLEVELSVQERDIGKVFPGQSCRVRAEAFPEHEPYVGTVSRLRPIADRARGAIPVRVKITPPSRDDGASLRPEMSVVVSFYRAQH